MLHHAFIIMIIILRASTNRIISYYTVNYLSRRSKWCYLSLLLIMIILGLIVMIEHLHHKDLVFHEITESLLVPSGVHC